MYYTIFAVSLTKEFAKDNNKAGQRDCAIFLISNCKFTRSVLFFQIFNPKNFNKTSRTMVKLSRDKVRAMLPDDHILVLCDSHKEVDSAFQTAKQMIKELRDNGSDKRIAVSRSYATNTVVLRTGINI